MHGVVGSAGCVTEQMKEREEELIKWVLRLRMK